MSYSGRDREEHVAIFLRVKFWSGCVLRLLPLVFVVVDRSKALVLVSVSSL